MPANWTSEDERYLKGLCDGADDAYRYIEQVERELTELRKGPIAQQLNAAALRVERQRAERAEFRPRRCAGAFYRTGGNELGNHV
jgi:hypothetical protein